MARVLIARCKDWQLNCQIKSNRGREEREEGKERGRRGGRANIINAYFKKYKRKGRQIKRNDCHASLQLNS